MYPKIYMDLFRSFEREQEVFVGMPFSSKFELRWKEIFEPAILSCSLKPYRTKELVVSDSITIDILDGIGRAKLLLFDISDERGKPNPNVMYELGIAHATRLPEEVIILRDDISKSSTFDISHIRWNTFSPKETENSITKIKALINNAESEIDLTKDKLVTKVITSLDVDMISFLETVYDYLNGVKKSLSDDSSIGRGRSSFKFSKEEKQILSTGFDLYPFDFDRKGLYSLGYKDCSEEHLREIARKLIEYGILRPAEPIPPEKGKIYGGAPDYYITELGKAVALKLKIILKERWPYIKRLTLAGAIEEIEKKGINFKKVKKRSKNK
jgi:hypothetical protein